MGTCRSQEYPAAWALGYHGVELLEHLVTWALGYEGFGLLEHAVIRALEYADSVSQLADVYAGLDLRGHLSVSGVPSCMGTWLPWR